MTKVPMYSTEQLPKGFTYPEAFRTRVDQPDDSLYPWVFIDAKSEVGTLLYKLGTEGGKKLIPFASLENGDGDVACFDGRNTTGDPPVIMLILDGSERVYGFKNFDHWLAEAQENA
jgi:hypothetical protein